MFRSALKHTLKVFAYILVITFLFTCVIEAVGEETLGSWLSSVPVLGQMIAGLIGLIPNCAASVAVATLYAKGVISAGAMLAGLLTGAGAGLLVLFRTNRPQKQNLLFVAALFLLGVLCGTLFHHTGLAAVLGL